jgi:molecular chaperone GrpE
MKNHEIVKDQESASKEGNQNNSDSIDQSASLETIEVLQNKIALLEDQLLRTAAESENVRRRYDRMLEESKDYSITNFAKDLLGVMDNLCRALECKIQENNESLSNIIAGVDMTKRELESIFKKYGLESIAPLPGEKFDYNLHHAVSQIVTDEYNHDNIIGTMQAGYKIKDRLLRPAMVTVAKKADE